MAVRTPPRLRHTNLLHLADKIQARRTKRPTRTPATKKLQGASSKLKALTESKDVVITGSNLGSELKARSLTSVSKTELKRPDALPTTKGLSIGRLIPKKLRGALSLKHGEHSECFGRNYS